MASRTVTLREGAREHTIAVMDDGRVRVGDRELSVVMFDDGEFRIGGPPAATAWAIAAGNTRWVFLDGRSYELEVPRGNAGRRRTGSHHGALTAPMPATVRRINVSTGDPVERGDTLIVLEAMKMELPVKSGFAGVVRAINCREGDLVQPGAELIEIDDAAEPGKQ